MSVSLLALGAFAGYIYKVPEVQIVEGIAYQDVIKEVPIAQIVEKQIEVPIVQTIEIEKLVEVPVEVEKIVKQIQPLRDFESLEVLKDWFAKNNRYEIVVGDGDPVTFGQSLSDNNDCDDQARRLQAKAFKDGYNMSLQIIQYGMLTGVKVSETKGSHMGNVAIIGNDVYYIEVGGDGPIFVCNLD